MEKIFRMVNSSFCATYQTPLRKLAPDFANQLIAETHEFSQSLVSNIIKNKLGKNFDFRIDFLLNVYRERTCSKKEQNEIYQYLKDKKNKPLYFVDSGGLQLLRIRLGILNKETVESFEEKIPKLIEEQEKLGNILMCLDYIPLWKRGEPIKKSEIVESCYKTVEYINQQLKILKDRKSDSKLLPINQLTQLYPNGFVWYDIIKKEIDFSDNYIGGYSITGFINTGNKGNENTLLYNIAVLTKFQHELYNSVNRPNLVTHILGVVSIKNEFFLYGLYNDNFNHISIDGVTYVKGYISGYIYDFPFKNYPLNGFGREFEIRTSHVYSLYQDIIEKYFGWDFNKYMKLLRQYHVNLERNTETRLAAYGMRMFYTYYQQIVAINHYISKLDFIGNKYGKIFNQIKEDPDYFIHSFGRNMESINMIDDLNEEHEYANIENFL